MTISVCMIVFNEAEVLGRALASTVGLADEVVVVDTGSEDGTVDVAMEFGANVVLDSDRRHLGEARNLGLRITEGDWVVILDADEVVADPVGVREFLEDTEADGAYVRVVFVDEAGRPALSYPQLRCWRRGAFEYRYRAHEVPVAVKPEARTVRTGLVWEHRRPGGREWKLSHFRELLEMDVAENPEDPRPLFYLGRQYVYCGEWEKGIATLQQYLLAPDHDEGDGWACLAQCYEALGERKRQVQALYQACAAAPKRREFWGMLAGVYHTVGENEVAAGLLEVALRISPPSDTYVNHFWYGAHIYDLLARCLWQLEEYEAGHWYARQAVEMAPGDERLRGNLGWFERKLGAVAGSR